MEPTKQEVAFIEKLQKLMDKAPKSLWFFSGGSNGNMTVMRYGVGFNGRRIQVMDKNEGANPEYILGTISGPLFEGGDW